MATYIITYGSATNYIIGVDTITANSLTGAKRIATRRAHYSYNINIWDCNQTQRLARRRYIGGGKWGAWESC